MRHGQILLLGLLVVALGGCRFGGPVQTTSMLGQSPLVGPVGSDVVIMDVALLERPVGDSYINHDLWLLADEQQIPFERKASLEQNGFVVGVVAGITPSRLGK